MKRYRYKKFYKKRKKSRIILSILKSRFFWVTILVFVASGLIFYFSVISSFFQIKEIKVFGSEKVAANNVKDVVFNNISRKIIFFNSKSIFFIDLKKAEKIILSSFPEIYQAKLKRKPFNALLVEIKERKPVAVFCQDSDCFFIDKEGVVFEKASKPISGLEIEREKKVTGLRLGKKIIEKEKIGQILKIKSKMEDDFKIPLKKISVISEERLNVQTEEGWDIYFNPEKDLNWQITELAAIFRKGLSFDKRKNLKYIDLRFNKIYIFPETVFTKKD